jgi:hypothetical protein
MRLHPIAAGLLLTGIVGCGTPVRESAFHANYSSTSSRISVDGLALTVVRLEHEYENPISAVPSRTEAHTKTVMLASKDLMPLKEAIRSSGFLALPAFCGAPEGERHYPYSIRVQIDGQAHEVVYRSNPSFPGCAKAFHEVEKLLQSLAAKAAE